MKDTLEGQIEERKKVSDLFQGVYNEFESRKIQMFVETSLRRMAELKTFPWT